MKAKPLGFKYNEVIVYYITQASAQKKHIRIFVRNFRLLSVSSLHHQLERKLDKVSVIFGFHKRKISSIPARLSDIIQVTLSSPQKGLSNIYKRIIPGNES